MLFAGAVSFSAASASPSTAAKSACRSPRTGTARGAGFSAFAAVTITIPSATRALRVFLSVPSGRRAANAYAPRAVVGVGDDRVRGRGDARERPAEHLDRRGFRGGGGGGGVFTVFLRGGLRGVGRVDRDEDLGRGLGLGDAHRQDAVGARRVDAGARVADAEAALEAAEAPRGVLRALNDQHVAGALAVDRDVARGVSRDVERDRAALRRVRLVGSVLVGGGTRTRPDGDGLRCRHHLGDDDAEDAVEARGDDVVDVDEAGGGELEVGLEALGAEAEDVASTRTASARTPGRRAVTRKPRSVSSTAGVASRVGAASAGAAGDPARAGM